MAIKLEQLHIRASERQKAKLAEAAQLTNQSVSQFILGVSLEAADNILGDQSRVLLSEEGFEEFCRLLDEPPKDLPKLRGQFAKGSIFQ